MTVINKLSVNGILYDIKGYFEQLNYTLGEVDTGNNWIDNKPIFRNIVEISNPTVTNYIDIDSDIDSIISMSGIIYDQSTAIIPIPGYGDSSHYSLINKEPDGRIRVISSNWTAIKIIVFLEYTKK